MIVLFMKISAFEDRSNAVVTPSELSQPEELISGQPAQMSDNTQPVLSSRQVRQIIREELQGINQLLASQSTDSGFTEEKPVRDETEMFYLQELVSEEMDLMKQQEEVSSMELEKLMMEIARLDPETRKEKLRELTMAINRGEINGSF